MTEKWEYVENTNEMYKVSNLGNVKSMTTNKLLTSKSLKSGYRTVWLKDQSYKVHRLVAIAFVENNDEKLTIVNHKDGDKLNNNVENLEWTTIAKNNKHAYDIGLNRLTRRAVQQLDKDDNVLQTFESLKDARDQTGVLDSTISRACKGYLHTAGGFKWKFRDVNSNEGVIDLANFKPIEGYTNYMISEDGTVYSTLFKKTLKQQTNAEGYLVISLANNKIKKSHLVHRLVAMHFIDNPDDKEYVNHKDGNRSNPKKDNLEWATPSENRQDAEKRKLKLQTPKSKAKA